MQRDRSEPERHGQQLEKTLELADFFVRNDKPSLDSALEQIDRFAQLIHGVNGVTPTRDEYGMYVAYASSLKSACLSRQVGAAILDAEGNLIGTGCNDVPRRGGGLYTCETGADDARCVKNPEQRCWNDHKKSELQREIERVLLSAGSGRVDSATAAVLAEAVRRRSSIKDLIEYSRAVHAEMEAIISVARRAASGLTGATLYTTTFPCHSCARHIVAAGVKRVFYIEPYERSLALELHGDSIALEADGSGKVEFIHFEGVAPRQYATMFRPSGERKTKDGMAVRVAPVEKEKSLPEYLDSYRDFESKVVEHWKQMGAILDGTKDTDGDS